MAQFRKIARMKKLGWYAIRNTKYRNDYTRMPASHEGTSGLCQYIQLDLLTR